jgi:hypothetical protein
VVVPPGAETWRRCLVIAADDGVHVFRSSSERADWFAPVDWGIQEALPGTDREARRGFSVLTERGLVAVTLGSGCRCGEMGRWPGPAWARTERVRA